MGGREKGTKNKSYLSLNYWFELISTNAEELTPKEKIEIAFRAVNVLAPKVQNLPTEPGDSVDNALRAHALLTSIENQPRPDSASANGSNGAHPNP